MTSTTVTLTNLAERLIDKASTLSEMSYSSDDYATSERLDAKASGVNLALSFVREALRDASRDNAGVDA